MMPLNMQPAEKRIVREDGALDVHTIFHTIQGEGPFAGHPAVFVRLAGCNLQCPMCDTEYTQGRQVLEPWELLERVHAAGKSRLIVLTGGEPFRQACGIFVESAYRLGHLVQIETNGTLYDPSMVGWWHMVTTVCSPKAGINANLAPEIDVLKYVVRAGQIDSEDGLPTSALDSAARPGRPPLGYDGPIYIQPCDEQDEERNAANRAAAVESCMKFDYILQLQIHKLLGMP